MLWSAGWSAVACLPCLPASPPSREGRTVAVAPLVVLVVQPLERARRLPLGVLQERLHLVQPHEAVLRRQQAAPVEKVLLLLLAAMTAPRPRVGAASAPLGQPTLLLLRVLLLPFVSLVAS